ncbi:thioredoxin fold domain-containing protein [Vibrio crassostreae]|uniref:thioredoxin fold domain-containing protein n=1 Tax=Vibrio crassostreae TaxID=246167 RepID=UPI001B30F761|nr:thioredoxin fold domain-containing protein [Vibrio crassostreae]
MIKKLLSLSVLSFVSTVAYAQDDSLNNTQISDDIKKAVLGGSEAHSFTFVKEISIDEPMYVVEVNGDYVVTNQLADKFFAGDFLNVSEKKNIKATWIQEVIKPIHDALPESHYVNFPATGVKLDTLWVYSDLNCPYCRNFHEQVKTLNAQGVEVNIIPFVRGLHGDVSKKNYDNTLAVFSEEDPVKRRKLYETAIQGLDVYGTNKLTAEGKDIVEKGYENGLKANTEGTPTLVNSFGRTYSGALDANIVAERFLPMQ